VDGRRPRAAIVGAGEAIGLAAERDGAQALRVPAPGPRNEPNRHPWQGWAAAAIRVLYDAAEEQPA